MKKLTIKLTLTLTFDFEWQLFITKRKYLKLKRTEHLFLFYILERYIPHLDPSGISLEPSLKDRKPRRNLILYNQQDTPQCTALMKLTNETIFCACPLDESRLLLC